MHSGMCERWDDVVIRRSIGINYVAQPFLETGYDESCKHFEAR